MPDEVQEDQAEKPKKAKSKSEQKRVDALKAAEAEKAEVNLFGLDTGSEAAAEQSVAAVPEVIPEPPKLTLEQKLEASEAEHLKQEIESLIQFVIQIIPRHKRIAENAGNRTIAISLGHILAATQNAQKNIGDEPSYWVRRQHK